MVENKKSFEKIAGKKAVDDKLFDIYFRTLSSDIYMVICQSIKLVREELTNIYNTIKRANIEGEDRLLAQCGLAIARANNDAVKMVDYIEKLMPIIDNSNLWSFTSSLRIIRS